MKVAVFVLAAGLGTRLRPLTSFLPKPLLPVGDRPALAHVLASVRPVAAPSRLVANTFHQAEALRAFAEQTAPDLRLSEEARILGTAGGLAHAAPLLGEGPVLVWNGDILASFDARALVAAHDETDSLATLAVKPLAPGQGNVGLDADGLIVRLRKETTRQGEVKGGAFLGVHVVGAKLRTQLPDEGCLVGDLYLPALRQGQRLRAWQIEEAGWHDIGTLRDYAEACFAWLAARGETSFMGRSVKMPEGVCVEQSLLGEGVMIEGQGTIERCIVWPGATVTAPCKRHVLTPWGAVALDG